MLVLKQRGVVDGVVGNGRAVQVNFVENVHGEVLEEVVVDFRLGQ